LRPRCFGGSPASFMRRLLFSHAHMFFTVLYDGMQYSSASSRLVVPAACFDTTSSMIPCGVFGVPFCPGIVKHPVVVILQQEAFFAIVRFFWACALFSESFISFFNPR
jgi:hypothetical protein